MADTLAGVILSAVQQADFPVPDDGSGVEDVVALPGDGMAGHGVVEACRSGRKHGIGGIRLDEWA